MGYTAALSESGNYIVCHVKGEVTVELARQFCAEMDRLSHVHNIKRFLTDVRGAPNTSNIVENYQFAYSVMNELGLQRDARCAILTSPGDRSHDFVETVERNAGYDVRIFDDEDSAMAWLVGDVGSPTMQPHEEVKP